MTITKNKDNNKLTIVVEGKIDSTTAPELEKEFRELEGINELVIDLEKVDYVSSAGLRAMLVANKTMAKQGSLVLVNLCEMVKEVFDMTGFTDIFEIK